MDLRDFIVAPLVILLVYIVAYFIRPRVCDSWNYVYFFPALTLKIIGALSLGFLYQFYYDGGDTFNYHTYGSRIVWEIFMDDPAKGLQLIFLPKEWHEPAVSYLASSKIIFYHDPPSFFVVRLAALFDLFTFSSYCGTAVLFAALSFVGCWHLFTAFYREFPLLHRWIAVAAFFIPSVFFWGSGILKDSPVVAVLGIAFFCIQGLFIRREGNFALLGTLLVISLTIMFIVKKYILMCFIPAALLWIYSENILLIKTVPVRVLVLPFVVFLVIVSSYYMISKISEDDPRYALDKLASTSRTTAYDIGFYTGRDAGSSYSLGELDGSFGGMLRLAPQAVNVALFRPYLWEVRNPLMLLSALESFALLSFTVWILVRRPHRLLRVMGRPYVLMCIVFSVTFAFAVGISTFNFGTLARYKIPMLPFFALALILLFDYSKRDRKAAVLESTE